MFATHKLNENGFEEVKKFKTMLSNAVKEATKLMPDTRERAIFFTKLDEAVFFGTKAIASKPQNHTEITEF
jgi:hypothetical protein